MIDENKKVTAWNHALEVITGIRKDEMIGQSNYAWSVPFYGMACPALIDLIDAPSEQIEGIYTNVKRIGQYLYGESFIPLINKKQGIYLWAVAAPLFDRNGNRCGAIEIIRDITDHKRLENERVELERRLLQTQKFESLGVLAGGIAHDFNNLLMAILGNLELALMEPSLQPDLRSGLEHAMQASHRAIELTGKMLAFSGHGAFVIKTLDLNELIRGSLLLFEKEISSAQPIRFDLAPEPLWIDVDQEQVQQMILHLITNAAESMTNSPGIIHITTQIVYCDNAILSRSRLITKPVPGQYVKLIITDTGCGMDQQTLDKVFDPFFSTKFIGRGMGLPAVMGIVGGYKGAVLIDSEIGHGTSVQILLPQSKMQQEEKGS